MSGLYGVDKINSILNSFLEEWECTVSLDSDFAYYHSSNLITYSVVIADNFGDKLFMSLVNKLCPEIKGDIFLWSLLHELGHHETIDDLEDDEIAYCQDEKERITRELEKCMDAETGARIASQYYVLPDEYAATAWAADFVRHNVKKVEQLWNELQPAIMEFYSLNNIKED